MSLLLIASFFMFYMLLRPSEFPFFLLDHVRHRYFGVLLKDAGHQAVTSDIIDTLKQRLVETLVLFYLAFERWLPALKQSDIPG